MREQIRCAEPVHLLHKIPLHRDQTKSQEEDLTHLRVTRVGESALLLTKQKVQAAGLPAWIFLNKASIILNVLNLERF